LTNDTELKDTEACDVSTYKAEETETEMQTNNKERMSIEQCWAGIGGKRKRVETGTIIFLNLKPNAYDRAVSMEGVKD